MSLILLTLVSVLIFTIWTLLKRPFQFWTRRGVKQTSPWIIFGDNYRVLFQFMSISELVEYVYRAFPDVRYSGMYQFMSPTLVLRDPDLIKEITIKNFDHFVDHHPFLPEGVDPLWSSSVISLTGQKWRTTRSTLSPFFTGTKMKYMFELINESAQRFVSYFEDKTDIGEVIEIEMKDSLGRFANDVIGTTAFGIECDSLRDPENEFYLTAKEATDVRGFLKTLRFFGFFFMPRMLKFLGVTFFSPKIYTFFTGIIQQNISSRQRLGIVRPDLLNLFLEARKRDDKVKFTDSDIAAQAFFFFLAGFDSISSLMCFTCHELAVNPAIQQRLIQEIDQVEGLTYEAVNGMKYLDMVISESLRKWSPSAVVDRVCTKSYTIEGPEPLRIDKNQMVWIPIHALHRDERYFPEPTKFDPERFNDKSNIREGTFIPFGIGPRACIGLRLAQLEAKVIIFNLLSRFEIVPIERTRTELELSRKTFVVTVDGGFWLGLKRRASPKTMS